MARVLDTVEGVALENVTKPREGRPSVIQKHCLRAIEEGRTECLWLCTRRRGRTIAKDIPLTTKDGCLITLFDLRKQFGWWKRYSLYSVMGVKEVMIRFLDFDEATNDVAVVTRPFDYERRIGRLDRNIDKAWDFEAESFECGVDIMGNGRSADDPLCGNRAMDQDTLNSSFCRVQNARDLEAQRDENQWLSPMLKYFWRNGIGSKGFTFLRNANFIMSYDSLCVDTFTDAACPFGKTANAFELVEGWRIRYLLCLVAASLICSICITAVGWLYGGSMGAGLTAGTYAFTVMAVPLGVLTFLSTVL